MLWVLFKISKKINDISGGVMSEFELGLGYWPDELDSDGNLVDDVDYLPWAKWRLVLFDSEAGDYIQKKEDVEIVLKNLGYKLVKLEQGVAGNDNG